MRTLLKIKSSAVNKQFPKETLERVYIFFFNEFLEKKSTDTSRGRTPLGLINPMPNIQLKDS